MQADRFDRMIRLMHRSRSRRTVVTGGAALAAGLGLGVLPSHPVAARQATPDVCPVTTPDENTALARRWHDEVATGRNLDALDELMAPTANALARGQGVPTIRERMEPVLTAFPDVTSVVSLTVAEGDLVATRYTATATQAAPFQGIDPAPDAAPITWTGINLYRIQCGRIAEIRTYVDALGRLQQIGGAPLSPPAGGADLSNLPGGATPCPVGDLDANKALAERYFSDLFQAGGETAVADLLTANQLQHWGLGPDTTGPEEFAATLKLFQTAFPDMTYTVDEIFGQHDLVVVRWTNNATQQGEWLGIPATGLPVSYTGVNIFRIACGKIAEIWNETDYLTLLEQLGSSPAGMATPVATPVS